MIAGFLCWCGVLPEPPRAISAVEQLLRHQMGAAGRSLVAISTELPPPPAGASELPLTPPDEPESEPPGLAAAAEGDAGAVGAGAVGAGAVGAGGLTEGDAEAGGEKPTPPRRPRRSRAAGPSTPPAP